MYELISKKIEAMRRAYAIETGPAQQVQLDHDIARLDRERGDIEKELEAIETLGDVIDLEEDQNRVQFGIEIIIEKLQTMDHTITRTREELRLMMEALGVKTT